VQGHSEVKDAMGEWLDQLAPWDVFSTWTFSRAVSVNGAMYFGRRHLDWLREAAGQPIYAFVGAEKGNRGGLIHLHALVGNVDLFKRIAASTCLPACGARSAACCTRGRRESLAFFLTTRQRAPRTTSVSTFRRTLPNGNSSDSPRNRRGH
jgi:hypothetical protein